MMSIRVVLRDYSFDIGLDYKTYCRSRDVDWPWCTLSWFLYHFSMGEVYVNLSHSASFTSLCNASGKPKAIVFYQLFLFFLCQGTLIDYRPSRHVCIGGCMSIICLNFLARRGCQGPKVGDSDMYHVTMKVRAMRSVWLDWWSLSKSSCIYTCWSWSTSRVC